MAEYTEREVTCADCIHYDICIFHHTGNENKKCVHFKNKADVVEVRRGEWKQVDAIFFDHEVLYFKCPLCNTTWESKTNYCPNCGAKMDGKGDG